MPGKDEEFGDDENSDDQVPEDLDPTSEEDVTENLSEEFITERDRFLTWLFNDEDLKRYLKWNIFKLRVPIDRDDLFDEVSSRVYLYCFTAYGKSNQIQSLWQAFENSQSSSHQAAKQDLLRFFKTIYKHKTIDVIKSGTELNPNANEEDIEAGEPKYIPKVEITADTERLEKASPNNELEFLISDSGKGNRIRNCLRKLCHSKHLATYLKIINLWEEGVHKPADICLKIPGLSPKTYNDLQGSLREFLKKNVNCWQNDENEEDPS